MTRPDQPSALERHWSEEARRERLAALRAATRAPLAELEAPLVRSELMRGQVENFVGVARVPVGVAGPLLVRGAAARGTFHVPLATTEGTLVLAVTRGAEAITAAGGAQVHAAPGQLTRAPLFVFASHAEARAAAAWVADHLLAVRAQAEATTRHGRLVAVEPLLFGRRLILEFVYTTGDAAGQNLVTFATDAACGWLRQQEPFAGLEFFTLESNASRDKKMTTLAPSRPRGRQVDAEIVIPAGAVPRLLQAPPEALARVAREGVYACALSGAVGAQAQVANVLTALFLATGQDVATIVECGTGLTVIEVTSAGDLYASVTIPNLVLGTVGGGTRLPTQRECLELMNCAGPDCAPKLAEIAGAAALAGELSLVGSLASGTFADAHATFGRAPREPQARQGEEP
jgi:hydroxymethylglutaryl-CoA reductase (NADPH)